MSRGYDMAGHRYGYLTAIRPTGVRSKANNRIWGFSCDCGNTCEIDGYDVRSGKRTECQSCARKNTISASTKHGMSETPEFGIWTDIQTRCYNPRSASYHNYGGRGIRMCDEWRRSFEAFMLDMGKRPNGASIERINNSGDYEPGNCRWASAEEQALNRRTNLRITIKGITKTAVEWARQCGLKPATLYRRFHTGWDNDALVSPIRKRI